MDLATTITAVGTQIVRTRARLSPLSPHAALALVALALVVASAVAAALAVAASAEADAASVAEASAAVAAVDAEDRINGKQ